MQQAPDNKRLTLTVEMEHDGLYWVARCPELRMTAAHQKKAVAWMRAVRMFPAQLVYAFNHDPAMTGLMGPEFSDKLETLRSFHKNRDAFMLCLEESKSGLKAEIPDLMAMQC